MSVAPDGTGDLQGIANAVAGLGGVSTTMEQTATEASGALTGLRALLGRLEALTTLSQEHRRNEAKIGTLFTKVEEYVARTTAEAQERARRVVADAEFEASRIVSAAKEEAQRLMAEARQHGGMPPAAILQLQSTIETFARLNQDLLGELAALNHTFDQYLPGTAPAVRADPPLPPPPPYRSSPAAPPAAAPAPVQPPTAAPHAPASGNGDVTPLFYRSA